MLSSGVLGVDRDPYLRDQAFRERGVGKYPDHGTAVGCTYNSSPVLMSSWGPG